MRFLFAQCSLLKSIPDISKWNISKIKNISYIFFRCLSLVQLPDISKWNKKSKIRNII